jgi:uncharacterized protein (TIGR02217 family)
MAFLEARLDARIERGAQGGPSNPGRQKAYLPNGRLKQNFLATMPKHYFDVSHGVRSRDDFQSVLDLWYVVNFTPYEGFRFRDWRDFRATQANTRLTNIAGNDWQLQRKHVFGGVEFLRKIVKPVSGTVVVYRTRLGAVTTATVVVDSTTGVVTITGHVSGDTYTWTGEFDIPVTFVDDEWQGQLEVHTDNLHVVSGSIKLEELML